MTRFVLSPTEIVGTVQRDVIDMTALNVRSINAGAGDDLMVARLNGSATVRGGDGSDGLIVRAKRDSVTIETSPEGWIRLRSVADPQITITVHSDVERIRFDDAAFDFAQLARLGVPVRETLPASVISAPVASPAPPLPIPGVPLAPTQPVGSDADAVARESLRGPTGVFGTAATEVLRGSSAGEIFYPNGGADTMHGGRGDDWYHAGSGTMVFERPGEGVDTVMYGASGTLFLPDNVENVFITNHSNRPVKGEHLVLLGDAGGPSAIGNELANFMVGSNANNWLDGRGGNDVLTGGGGKDRFSFGIGYGQDVVTDFTPGADKVRLVSGFRDFDAVRAALSDSAAGAVLRTASGDTLTLQGRKAAQFTAADFEFTVDISRYQLTFMDEFDSFSRFDGSTGLDGGTWRTRMSQGDGTRIGFGQESVFMDTNTAGLGVDPFALNDGALVINGNWRPDLAPQFGGRAFTSGVITTEGTFAQQYGYFEARVKVSDWAGGFPAFWLLPTDHSWPPEIDIMEQLGRQPGMIYQMGNWVPIDHSEWNTYAVEWTKDRIAWFVNGEMTHVVYDHGQHKPMYVILNYNLGGSWAGKVAEPGAPGDSVGDLQIDYVRVYELKPGEAGRQPPATDAANAPLVTYSVGALTPGGVAAEADRWMHLADTTGKLLIRPEDLSFGSARGWIDLRVDNNRAEDSYAARNSNGWYGLNVQVVDDDGGAFSFDAMTMVELRLAGRGASTVEIGRSQYGRVDGGDAADVITISNPQVWVRGRDTSFEVRAGGGADTITGWSSGDAQSRMIAHGGDGADRIIGSIGNDRLFGGAGNDVLTGGGGSDRFVFVRGEAGRDVVTDFTPGVDRIELRGYASSAGALRDTSDGALLELGDQSVLLLGRTAQSLAASLDWAL